MKTTTKKITFVISLLLVLAIGATFTSCTKNNVAYNKEVKTADSLFNVQQYLESKTHYENALKLKKDEAHPKNQLVKINTLLAEIKEKETKPETEIKETKIVDTKVTVTNPYIVVVASYAIESNANAHQKKLNNKGYKTSIVKSSAGNYLVSLQAFSSLTKSYNYLNTIDVSEDYDLNALWVYKIK